MKWSDRYATGIEQLDAQHRTLFRMSEDYRDSLSEGKGERTYGVLLQMLEAYARAHFGFEEQCMYRYQCPVAQTNRAAHARFIAALGGFRTRYAAAGFVMADAEQLVEFLDGWLDDHIGRIDVELKQLVEKPIG